MFGAWAAVTTTLKHDHILHDVKKKESAAGEMYALLLQRSN
jgi:hypothetical protein